MNAAIVVSADGNEARTQLRKEHGVTLIRAEDEGNPLDAIAPGSYGFTYAPATESPVFLRQSYHSFEMHRLPDGSGRLIGFCSTEDAKRVQEGGEIRLYPDPFGDATQIVAVPLHQLVNDLYRPVRRDGNGVILQLLGR